VEVKNAAGDAEEVVHCREGRAVRQRGWLRLNVGGGDRDVQVGRYVLC